MLINQLIWPLFLSCWLYVTSLCYQLSPHLLATWTNIHADNDNLVISHAQHDSRSKTNETSLSWNRYYGVRT